MGVVWYFNPIMCSLSSVANENNGKLGTASSPKKLEVGVAFWTKNDIICRALRDDGVVAIIKPATEAIRRCEQDDRKIRNKKAVHRAYDEIEGSQVD